MADIAFWQRIVSPHMGALAAELARRGHKVTYVAERAMSRDRSAMGWQVPDILPAKVLYAPGAGAMCNSLEVMPLETVHLCQGLRANGGIQAVQKKLAVRGLKHWAIIEKVDDSGPLGVAKRLMYSSLVRRFQKSGVGMLAIGEHMPAWLVARGATPCKVIPFAYFLPEVNIHDFHLEVENRPFRIVFVGQIIARKRLQDLIIALAQLSRDWSFELWIIGDGPEASALRKLGVQMLPDRIRWLGTLTLYDVSPLLSQVDLLVLPSRHDGWGAVVSEALMQGTPAICSDQCGSAGVVKSSSVGGVFPAGDPAALAKLILDALGKGQISSSQRITLSDWALSLGAVRGAEYLEQILQASDQNSSIPDPPWVEYTGPGL